MGLDTVIPMTPVKPVEFPIAPTAPAEFALDGARASSDAGVDRQQSFARALGIEQRRLDAASVDGETPEARARTAAERFVAQAFLQPLLKELRASNQAPAPFAPGPGEKQFRSLMDQTLAEDLAKSARLPLVDRLARDLLRASGEGGSIEVIEQPNTEDPT